LWRTVLDKMVLGQTLETAGGGESLRHQYANGDRYLILLGGRPSVDVLQKSREGGLFKRFLKILVSAKIKQYDSVGFTNKPFQRLPPSPSDQFILHIDVLLELLGRSRFLGIDDSPRTNR
jgi:hypothetical protein